MKCIYIGVSGIKKTVLEDDDYFILPNTPENFDVYRLFKEISILCKDKILPNAKLRKNCFSISN